MKITSLILLLAAISELSVWSQTSGNAAYDVSRRRTSGVLTGNLSATEPKDSVPASFIEANVVLNLKADEYMAVFALSQEGPTVFDGNEKLTAQVNEFIAALEKIGVKKSDISVDFINQNRVYDFTVTEKSANESLSGFQVKKNITIRYKEHATLEKMLAAAARSSIFDLVKVDYVVSDLAARRAQLLEEASKVIRKKEAAYAGLFGIKMRPASVFQEKYNGFYPSESYNSYAAFETSGVYRGNLPIVAKRKASTFYYTPLDPSEFDVILGQTGLEPVVQLTLFLKVKYSPDR